ncbi:DUF2946 family protein [Nitrospirillum amazonense]|uniref:DUF2946 family protein n=1 Tax=Nitrospirillum amazonense TaxID=28077 RepID=UPI002DD434E9|nr:DUF2946 family protein [Nitrospirillum amazonense]MEC4589660.1 DUF2946 family protein [Nitrospirillum amazonense]
MIQTRTRAISTAAALFALLLLSFASVQSIVMQVAMAPSGASMPTCHDADPVDAGAAAMAGMDMRRADAASPHDHHQGVPPQHKPQQHKSACPYCSVAAHAPLLAQAVPVRQATRCVFIVFEQVASIAPCGPPAFQPRARGPPTDPLIV